MMTGFLEYPVFISDDIFPDIVKLLGWWLFEPAV
jgi:hypothetical protein